MALAGIEKIQIVGHLSRQDEVVQALQETGLVELVKPSISEESSILPGGEEEFLSRISDLEQAIEYLDGLEKKKGLVEGLVKEKILLGKREFYELLKTDYKEIQQEVRSIQEEYSTLLEKGKRLRDELKAILPWLSLEVALSEIKDTGHVVLIPGVLPVKKLSSFNNYLSKEFGERFSIQIVSQTEQVAYVLIAMLKEDSEKFKPQEYEFSRLQIPEVNMTPVQRMEEIEREFEEIKKRKTEIKTRAEAMHLEKLKLMVFYDHLLNLKKKEEAKRQFFNFPHAFVIEGWIRKRDIKRLQEELKKKFEEIEIFTIKPGKNEIPPAALENRKVIEPFEMITRMYGVPGPRDIDPTAFFAPFFVIFFGLCLTDAGYGIILIIMSSIFIFIRRHRPGFKLNPLVSSLLLPFKFFYNMLSSELLLKILFWGGVLTIFAGAITGGWFGDATMKFPLFSPFKGLNKLMLFDPMKNPMVFFAIALALGFVQICYGLCLKIYTCIKNGSFIESVYGPISQLCVLLGFPVILIVYILPLFKISISLPVPQPVISAATGMTVFGFLNLFIYPFITTEDGILIKLFMGVYAIYSTVMGILLGDVLSYSRLLALGLATSGISLAVNVMVEFALPVPVIGILAGAAIFLIGHFLNMVINSFGGFVHSMRLQYVEFFTKFYENGGREFRPFKKEYKYILLEESDG